MRTQTLGFALKAARAFSIYFLAAAAGFAQQGVNLTAGPSTLTMPDGSTVPMWGYTCGTAVGGSTAGCAPLHPGATGWSPVVITVPTGQGVTIHLTNSLSFANGNKVPTSIMIVGQLGGGLGTTATSTPSPSHSLAQENTWPIANPGVAANKPPAQGPRVQSFATEVAAGATRAVTWTAANLQPGTYLLESGTHPSIQGPMGLYGILVVTTAPSGGTGTAYPGVTYNAEVPLLFSEIDPVQNAAVNAAVNTSGFTETAVWSGQPGGCGNPGSASYQTCYPPAVNYTPLYYLINGVAFDRTHAASSLFAATPASGVTGAVLVRMVNAGLRMHVPSIVGAQTGSGTSGFSLIAEDGNPLPGVPRVQSEVFMAAGKTYDVMVNVPAAGGSALPVYDRQLSLSGNATARDAGMLAYVSINGTAAPAAPAFAAAAANPDTYNSAIASQTFTVSDPARGVIANDVNIYGVRVTTAPTKGSVTLAANGTFTYTAKAGWSDPDRFVYCGNGATTGAACATVTVHAAAATTGINVNPITYTSNVATALSIKPPGVLSVDKDLSGYPLFVDTTTVVAAGGLTISVDQNGGFVASVNAAGTYAFTYKAKNVQGTQSASAATVTLIFPQPTGLAVTVKDGKSGAVIPDYRWIIEEDRTFYVDPKCTPNPPPAGCPSAAAGIVPTFGTNFHTSFMPVVAAGCTGPLSCGSGQTIVNPGTGVHTNAVCDVGNGVCRTTASQETAVDPKQVSLDPTRRYYLSVLPGDAANPFNQGNLSAGCTNGVTAYSPTSSCGHGLGGAPIAAAQTSVTVLAQPSPYPPAKLSVMVFEDDFPLNGEQDPGGGIDVIAVNEPGLGGFEITLFDDAGGPGDPTGQPTFDMFNQPLANSLAGTKDPVTGFDACPLSPMVSRNVLTGDRTQLGISGMIVTCPKFESDGKTLSPLAGQAVIGNLYPGRYGVVATPGADRIARGEEWLQTNTLDGQKAHDSFLRIGEPSYFQEFGPAGYHVAIGFANPAVINGRKAGICNGTDPNLTATNCTNSVKGVVTTMRVSRIPDERLYSSGSNTSFAFTQCYVSLGDTDGEDFAFTKCNSDGSFLLTGIPDGNWRVTIFDQWNDMLVDGLSTPVLTGGGKITDLGQIAMNQWQANFYTRTFLDLNGDGVSQASEPGLALVKTNVRYRDGSFSNRGGTDLNGYVAFNEEFPLFSWYVIETDESRYKNTGTHVVYDSGGPADGTPCGASVTPPTAPCGGSTIGKFLANTAEQIPVPANLRVPGGVYCDKADCTGLSIATGPITGGSSGPGGSTGRIDPPWVLTEGWQGFSGQNNFLEFGKKPFAVGENGGIRGHVVYSSTRPFDDPQFGTQNTWEPLVPGVTINLYQQGAAPDGSQSLTLVDTTQTSSWDAWAQGFRSDGVPNMNCPGQGRDSGTAADLFFFTLYNQPMYLDFYSSQHGGGTMTALPLNSQFKCYDGMHNWNQLQPAPYDGMYQFPSVTGLNPTTGKPSGTNCTICGSNPDATDPYRSGLPMLPAGKYVVEVIVPPGYQLVKEEDKNILIGDAFIAPTTVEFPGLGLSVFILPDQAAIGAAYNPNNAQDPTQTLGRIPSLTSHEGDTPTVSTFWPCVGQVRVVPDYISLFPGSHEVAPFAGATRPLCDRKQVTLDDQGSAQAEFFIFTETPKSAHFTGIITDDFTSEFDPFSPQFGEKFSPANLPVSIKDWTGNEISRVYSDQWGAYDGLTYSTWEVNPPNPTGYAPGMMITCMNDPGTGATPDPLYNTAYSQFCYETPFMPGATQYMDTPVVPTSAFAGAGYNNPDCNYPALTPAIKEVDGDGVGPWVSSSGHTLTITALGDMVVPNYGYSGPSATTAPFNQKTVTRHYGFGGSKGSVSIGGVNVSPGNITTWNDSTIVVTVPDELPRCTIQQQAQYGGSTARCGQLVITRADNGLQSIDTVTVTVGGKPPSRVAANGSIQAAIDAAAPGDLIIVPPGIYSEMLIMWKPVRLQGVGAASSVINANIRAAGLMDAWRARVNCLFGLALNGQPYSTGTTFPGVPANPYDPTGALSCPATGWNFFGGGPDNPQVDRLPLEGIVGWDATLNGNLAQLLQEPTLMGAYEGAGITVVAKGVRYPTTGVGGQPLFVFGNGDVNAPNQAHEGQMPFGTVLLTNSDADCNTLGTGPKTGYTSNFQCNPSRIDGLAVTNSSQGGGGIFLHAWAHNLEISNNRVYNNTGTLTGGIVVGQGESPDALYVGNNGDPMGFDQQPWTCVPGAVTNGTQNTTFGNLANYVQLPYCYNTFVNIHNNAVTQNSSIGDEVFSGTPTGAGGVSFCIGADYYKFNYNWVCGNLSTGDGGGVAHIGYSYYGDIEHNTILFNQTTNPTIQTNGGGIVVLGAAPDGTPPGATPEVLNLPGTECGATTDVDCAPGLSDGTGPGLVINANLIMGNAAESGSGGGIRLQSVNGTEVGLFPNGGQRLPRLSIAQGFTGDAGYTNSSTPWNDVTVTNNIIVNNVAGWDGGGVSLQDALAVNFVNNTVMSNDSTASSGVLFNTLGAPLASAPGATNQTTSSTASAPQPAGLVSMRNSALLSSNVTAAAITCPAGHATGNSALGNKSCLNYSIPLMYNNLFWQNRSFYIGVGALGSGGVNQQNVVSLYNSFTATRAATQPQGGATTPNGGGAVITGGTGACVSQASYWDIGVRGDTGPANHGSGLTLAPQFSILTDATDYPGNSNLGSNPTVLSQYCNGSRVPPEFASLGYQVPPGIADATMPNPIFNLTPAATVDEGNNWINMSWGPLAMANPVTGAALGNYAIPSSSPAVNSAVATLSGVAAPGTDFFGNPRSLPFDIGAVEFAVPAPRLTSISPAQGLRGTAVAVTLTGVNLTGATAISISGSGVTAGSIVVVNDTTVTATFTVTATASSSARNVALTTPIGTSNGQVFTVLAPALTSITPNSGLQGASVPVILAGSGFGTAGAADTIAVAGTGVTVKGVTVVSDTQITATLVLASNATTGGHAVSVTTAGGASTGTMNFSVNAPSLNSVSPNSGRLGAGVAVTLTGSGFGTAGAADTVAVAGTGVAASAVTVVSDTRITATFTIAGNATLGTHAVSVTTASGATSGTANFTVNPTLTSVTPNSGARGNSVAVTLAGSGFGAAGAADTVAVSGSGVTVGGVTVVSDTQITATFAIAANANGGSHSVSVTTAGGTSTGTVNFTVNSPTLASVGPNSGTRGTSVAVTLTGTGFGSPGAADTVAVSGNGVTVSAVKVVSDTQITATFTIASTATTGQHAVSVTNAGSVTTGNANFTVN